MVFKDSKSLNCITLIEQQLDITRRTEELVHLIEYSCVPVMPNSQHTGIMFPGVRSNPYKIVGISSV
jgi:hypothetical protein